MKWVKKKAKGLYSLNRTGEDHYLGRWEERGRISVAVWMCLESYRLTCTPSETFELGDRVVPKFLPHAFGIYSSFWTLSAMEILHLLCVKAKALVLR